MFNKRKLGIVLLIIALINLIPFPQVKVNAAENSKIKYESFIQELGWQESAYDGETSGTSGQSKRLEAIKISLVDPLYEGGISYRAHVENIGWQDWVSNGELSGTEGLNRRLEAIEIKLTGEMENKYDVYYRVHSQSYGWLGWAKNGEPSGTEGYSKRVEAIEIVLVEKGGVAPGSTDKSFIAIPTSILYQTHVENYGWQNWVSDGALSGTSGESKRLEAIKIELKNNRCSGEVTYRTHVQNIGWQDWVNNGELSGTSGQSKRLEAIEIRLTGEIAEKYDIYYRVHAQDYGWLGWAKNGESAGTEGLSKRLEAIEIRLVEKGTSAPESESSIEPFIKDPVIPDITYQTHVQNYGWLSFVSNGKTSGTSGESKRVEGLKVKIENTVDSGDILYKTHVQSIGWQNWVSNGELSGTEGQSKRLEAVQIKLTDVLAQKYDIYYRVHVQDYGWLGWAKNGASAGTEGLSKRLEAIEIVLVNKGDKAPGSINRPFIDKNSIKKTVVIDPGHNYGGDDGAKGTINGITYYERDLNMKVSLYLKGYLEGYGYNVVLTRQPMDRDKVDVNTSLANRVNIANNAKADVFISVHHNSFQSSSANGCEVYYHSDSSNTTKYNKSKILATNAVNNISRNTGFYNRGAKTANYVVLRGTNMPSILVEGGFMSNSNDLSSLIKDMTQKNIAKGIADAVKASF